MEPEENLKEKIMIKENIKEEMVRKSRYDNNYKNLLIISLVIVGFLGVGWIAQGVFYYQSQADYNQLQGDYNQLQMDYNQTLMEMYNLNQELLELTDALEELDLALEDLQEILTNIEDSTDIGLYIMQNIQFKTNYGTNKYNYWTQIPFRTYFNFRLYEEHTYDRTSYSSLVDSIEDFCDSSSVKFIADTILSVCVDENDDEEVANAILNFVQEKGKFENSLHYIAEEDDMPKFPIETIAEGGGDCEDLSILYVSLLESIGFDTILLVIPGHCFAGVNLASAPTYGDGWSVTYNEKSYYTCETTAEGWRVGDLPESSQGESVYIEEVVC